MRGHIQSLVERYIGRGRYSGESNISLRCPFHKGGEEKTPSFSVNVDLGLFNCFTCHVSGPMPKMLRLLGVPRHVIDDELKDIRQELDENKKRLGWRKRAELVTKDPFLSDVLLPESILKPFEWCPVKLVEAGFQSEWLKYMDIGFDRSNNRITYPIRDVYGNLAGIAGGAVIAGTYPKYKVYQGGHKDPETGKWVTSDFGQWFDESFPDYTFSNHNYLWNFDQVYPRLFFGREKNPYLILVEGYKAALWVLQCGFLNTVALMGSSLSDRQASLLHRLQVNIVLFLDNDQAGRRATRKIARKLRTTQQGVFIAQYPYADDCQPDGLVPAEVTASIQGAQTYPQWEKETRR